MNWRLENKLNYYSKLVEMWTDWGFAILPIECLPDRIYVVYDENNIDLYAIPVYITDSNFAWIGFPTGNKKAPKTSKEGAFKYLLDIIGTTLKYQGFSRLITTSMNPKLMKEFEESDFSINDEGCTFYLKIL